MSIDHESVFVTKSYVVGRTNDQSGWHGFLRVGKKEGLMSKKQDFSGAFYISQHFFAVLRLQNTQRKSQRT